MLRRRELLISAGAAAGAYALSPLRALADPLSSLLNGGGLEPELVAVTPTSFTVWWPTAKPGDTTVRFGPADRPLRTRTLTFERDQLVHAATVDGLEPGRTYSYELETNGRRIASSAENPEQVTTLVPPKGRLLARIAVLNDMHVGEGCSGTAAGIADESVPPCFSEPSYAVKMLSIAVREIRGARPDLVIANGDLTDRGRPDEIRTALRILGRVNAPLVVTRGNHDRKFDGCAQDGDCLGAAAFPSQAPGDHTLKSLTRVGARVTVIGLDSADPDSGTGRLDQSGQLEFLQSSLALAGKEGRKAIVAFHHHIAPTSAVTGAPPVVFGVQLGSGGREALETIAASDDVALVIHGHTHRNYVSYGDDGAVPFCEFGAIKEYGGSWTMLHVHEDGVMRTLHRVSEPFAKQWIQTTAQQYYGRYPEYTRGPLSARAFVHHYGCTADVPGTAVNGLELPARSC